MPPTAKTTTKTKKSAPKRVSAKKPSAAPTADGSAAGGHRDHKMDAPAQLLERIRVICLALPETTEVMAWGHPTFRVRDKIFTSAGGEDGEWSIGVKVTPEMQAGLVESDPRFSIAKYVGKHGWVTMRVGGKIDWKEIEALVEGSYRLIAPQALVKKLEGSRG
jgi:predicted DNA-binding protein (MmcQ/YjbR family)